MRAGTPQTGIRGQLDRNSKNTDDKSMTKITEHNSTNPNITNTLRNISAYGANNAEKNDRYEQLNDKTGHQSSTFKVQNMFSGATSPKVPT